MKSANQIIKDLTGCAIVIFLLIVAAGFFLVISNGWTVGDLFIFDKELAQANRTGREIIDYDLPKGFSEAFSTEIGEYKFVSYTGDDGYSHIYLIQLPSDTTLDQTQLEKQAEKAMPISAGTNRDTRVVETQPVTIAGQEVTLVISEGTNYEGDGFRQASTIFQGKGGQAIAVFSRPTVSWDESEVKAFFASIR